jgi:hypothetical protein
MKRQLTKLTLVSVLMLSALSSGIAIARSGGGGGRGHHGAGHAAHAATHSRGYRFSGYPISPYYYYSPLAAVNPAQRFCASTGYDYVDARDCPEAHVPPLVEPVVR